MSPQEKRIVQCPFCQTKFYVWLSLLVDRRRVKCSNCQNVWFQDASECEESSAPVIAPPVEVAAPQKPQAPKEPEKEAEEPQSLPKADEIPAPIRFISNEPEKKESMGPLPAFDDESPFPEEILAPKKKYRKRFSLVAFLIPLLLVIFARDYIVRGIPAMAYVYRLAGLSLKKSQEGFELRNTSWYEVTDKGIPSIVVNGELANMASAVKTAPAVRVTMRGHGGCHPTDFASYIFGDDKAEGPDGLCVVDQWTINVSYDRLLPGQVVPFSTTHPYDERSKVEKIQIDFTQ